MSNYIVVKCPHCNDDILIFLTELNCRIFRHGIYKSNFEQIDPHLDMEKCNELVSKDMIYGCGKPFEINEDNSVIICDYNK